MIVSLDDSVKKTVSGNGFGNGKSGKPTQKQLDYLQRLAKETGTELSEDVFSSFDAASSAIDRLQKKIKPTDKQIAFAQKIAKEKGITVPKEAMESKSAMSKWLDRETSDEK